MLTSTGALSTGFAGDFGVSLTSLDSSSITSALRFRRFFDWGSAAYSWTYVTSVKPRFLFGIISWLCLAGLLLFSFVSLVTIAGCLASMTSSSLGT